MMNKTERLYRDFLEKREEHALKRSLLEVKTTQGGEIEHQNQRFINFSHNDYLGLSHHPALIERSQEWAQTYGAGAGASRLVTGNLEIFSQIEQKIAALKKSEAALVMVSGFQANASVLPALFDREALGAEPLVFADKLNHASMHLGCKAAGVTQIRYRHNDMAHLQELLEKHKDTTAPKFILTESVFSMDGDIAPLAEIQALANAHECFTIIDEAHATGVMGERGAGLAQDADIVIGTFSKAMGSFGAYVACSKIMRDYLVNKCGGLIYATALPPATLGAIDASLDIMPPMNKEREYLQAIAAEFRREIEALGYDTAGSQSQIVPLITGDSQSALDLSDYLKGKGIWATAIRPPTVPAPAARVRFAFSALHSAAQMTQLVESLKQFQQKKKAA